MGDDFQLERKLLLDARKRATKSPLVRGLLAKQRWYEETLYPMLSWEVKKAGKGSKKAYVISTLDVPEALESDPDYAGVVAAIKAEKASLAFIDSEHEKEAKTIKAALDKSMGLVEKLVKNEAVNESRDKFLYQYLDNRATNDTFSKIFELATKPDYFYILTHNNKQINRANMQNPYLAEVTISRVSKEEYLAQNATNDYYEGLMARQPRLCLHDYIPGTV